MTENAKYIVVEDVKENNELKNDEVEMENDEVEMETDEIEMQTEDEVIESTTDNVDTVEDIQSFHSDSEDSTVGCSSNGFDVHFE